VSENISLYSYELELGQHIELSYSENELKVKSLKSILPLEAK